MGYRESIKEMCKMLPIEKGKFLVTGATGLIGSCVIDVLLAANKLGAQFEIYAMSRSKKKIIDRFGNEIVPIVQDIMKPVTDDNIYDYIVHCASNADPISYATQPVETILTNVVGTKNILEYCKKHTVSRMLLASTFEVYGYAFDVTTYKENISGIIDQTRLRNGYPESKRCAELLLRSYVDEYGVNAVIARLPSVYGPTMNLSDSKAHAQFIKSALKKENIILKSKGQQKRTYSYVIDVVSGIFEVLLNGNDGEIYNISNEKSVASIAEIAEMCAEIAGTKVIFDLPNKEEAKGFSTPHDCILDNDKLKGLGWNARYSLEDGLRDTIEYLMENNSETSF